MKLKPIRGFGKKYKAIKIIILGLFLAMFGLIIYKHIPKKEKAYYGVVNEQIFESEYCYATKQIGYCKKRGKFVVVDCYYQ